MAAAEDAGCHDSSEDRTTKATSPSTTRTSSSKRTAPSAGSTPRAHLTVIQVPDASRTSGEGADGSSVVTVPDDAAVELTSPPTLRLVQPRKRARSAEEGFRICRKCGAEKPLTVEYWHLRVDNRKHRHYWRWTCRDCVNAAERKPCRGCGAPRLPGRGSHYCADCQAQVPSSPHAPCLCCGARTPKKPGVQHCADCADLAADVAQARRNAQRALKRKPCKGCGRVKEPGRYIIYCAACRRKRDRAKAEVACRYCGETIRDRRPNQRTCDVCKATHERESWHRAYQRKLAKRAADPKFDVEWREHRSRLARQSRAAARTAGARRKGHRTRFPVPVVLAAAERAVEADRAMRDTANGATAVNGLEPLREAIAKKLGISDRRMREWRSGRSQFVLAATVEKLMDSADLCWWEIFDESCDPKVREAAEREFGR